MGCNGDFQPAPEPPEPVLSEAKEWRRYALGNSSSPPGEGNGYDRECVAKSPQGAVVGSENVSLEPTMYQKSKILRRETDKTSLALSC